MNRELRMILFFVAATLCWPLQIAAQTFVIPPSAVWRFKVGHQVSTAEWRQIEFDDSAWKTGESGFGYGDDDDRTKLPEMQGKHPSVRIRREFHGGKLDTTRLFLYAKYDDGFIAYLNGKEVARTAILEQDSSVRAVLHEAESFESFVIPLKQLLRPGKNVFAIEGLNSSLDSSDFSLDVFVSSTPIPNIHQLLLRHQVLEDIDEFESRLLDQSSYLTRRGFDYKGELERLRSSIHEIYDLEEFEIQLRRLICKLGDCHAGVYSRGQSFSHGYLPCKLVDTKDGIAAIKIDQSGEFVKGHPFVVSIDGMAIDTWLTEVSQGVPYGSPQLVRRFTLNELRMINRCRRFLRLPVHAAVRITVTDAQQRSKFTSTHPIELEAYAPAEIPLGKSKLIDDIGYLRIRQMDNRLIPSLHKSMQEFRDAKGLIIDVRNNSGGRYGIIEALYGYFVPDGSKPYVTNVAKFRLGRDFLANHLYYRPTHPVDHPRWNNEQRQVIKSHIQRFKPEWNPPKEKFSDWHFMLLERSKTVEQFHFERSVVVLCNAGSFSATDGFLSAFADLPQVKLMGEPSSGGSGSTRYFELPASKLQVGLSSMASFRNNGMLFDGNGVEVDVRVQPDLQDYFGKSDRVLKQAIEWIREADNQADE